MVRPQNVFQAALWVAGCLWATSSAHSQVVQLPTIRTFSYSGAVRVPDRGSISLGGGGGSASSFNRRGFGGGSGFGRTSSTSDAIASAHIIDLREMDRNIRGEEATGRVAPHASSQRTGSQHASSQRTGSQRHWTAIDYGKAFVRKARIERKAGKDSAAFESYRKAVSLLSGELLDLASREFRREFGAAASQVIANR